MIFANRRFSNPAKDFEMLPTSLKNTSTTKAERIQSSHVICKLFADDVNCPIMYRFIVFVSPSTVVIVFLQAAVNFNAGMYCYAAVFFLLRVSYKYA